MDTSGDKYSKKPLSKTRAEKQLKALHINTGHGLYCEGGMMRVSNPLVPQVTPEQEAKAVIQRILNSANSARSMSITIPEGHKSMEKIMNESALELSHAGKSGAVKYLNQLRSPYESREDYKKEDSTERNKVAKEMGLEIKYGGKNKCGTFSEPDTHILIGDELDGSGRKADLRKEYDAIMRRTDLTPQQREDIVRTFQATTQRLNEAGKSYSNVRRIFGLPETETGRQKNRLFQQGSLAMQRLAPVRLIQHRNPLHMIGNVNTELAQQEALDDALGITGYANNAEDDEDPDGPPAQVGEGKIKFIKKYLKGQGIPATKKNVAKICNIMDVEGIVFE